MHNLKTIRENLDLFKKKIIETGTSNLIFIKEGKIFSPKKYCYFGNTIKFINKKIKINYKDISIISN